MPPGVSRRCRSSRRCRCCRCLPASPGAADPPGAVQILPALSRSSRRCRCCRCLPASPGAADPPGVSRRLPASPGAVQILPALQVLQVPPGVSRRYRSSRRFIVLKQRSGSRPGGSLINKYKLKSDGTDGTSFPRIPRAHTHDVQKNENKC